MPTNITMKPYIQMPRFGKLSTVSSTAKIHHVRPCTKGRGSFLSCRAQGYFHHQSVPRFFPTFLRPRLRVVRLYIFFFGRSSCVLLFFFVGPSDPGGLQGLGHRPGIAPCIVLFVLVFALRSGHLSYLSSRMI
jgi:hypothetical protein